MRDASEESRHPPRSSVRLTAALLAALSSIGALDAQTYEKTVAPFFESHCIRCHGPKKSKGRLTVHTLEKDLTLGNRHLPP